MREFKVGEKVTITLEAVESEECNGRYKCDDCFFCFRGVCTIGGKVACCASERSDGKWIVFKMINK